MNRNAALQSGLGRKSPFILELSIVQCEEDSDSEFTRHLYSSPLKLSMKKLRAAIQEEPTNKIGGTRTHLPRVTWTLASRLAQWLSGCPRPGANLATILDFPLMLTRHWHRIQIHLDIRYHPHLISKSQRKPDVFKLRCVTSNVVWRGITKARCKVE